MLRISRCSFAKIAYPVMLFAALASGVSATRAWSYSDTYRHSPPFVAPEISPKSVGAGGLLFAAGVTALMLERRRRRRK